VVGILARKDADGILRTLSEIAAQFIFVPISGEPCIAPDQLLLRMAASGISCATAETLAEAVTMAGGGPNGLICITGSLYLVAEWEN